MEHIPVLVSEVLEYLITDLGGVYLDGTVGSGGHAGEILGRLAPQGRLVASDWDDVALENASEKLASYGERVSFYQCPFAEASSLLSRAGVDGFSGMLLDLGLSSVQLSAGRGFSFNQRAPLDMRMDRRRRCTAAEIVNSWGEEELSSIIKEYGEERQARRIARAIVQARPFADTAGLAAAVSRGAGGRHGKLHPATRTFQALRLAVNDELGQLAKLLEEAPGLLRAGGRLVIISFHSLEDRLVKRYLKGAGRAYFRELTKKPLSPERQEQETNRRARSAKLRAAERL